MAGSPGLLLHPPLEEVAGWEKSAGLVPPRDWSQNDSPREATTCTPKFNFNKVNEHHLYLGCLNERDTTSPKFYAAYGKTADPNDVKGFDNK